MNGFGIIFLEGSRSREEISAWNQTYGDIENENDRRRVGSMCRKITQRARFRAGYIANLKPYVSATVQFWREMRWTNKSLAFHLPWTWTIFVSGSFNVSPAFIFSKINLIIDVLPTLADNGKANNHKVGWQRMPYFVKPHMSNFGRSSSLSSSSSSVTAEAEGTL